MDFPIGCEGFRCILLPMITLLVSLLLATMYDLTRLKVISSFRKQVVDLCTVTHNISGVDNCKFCGDNEVPD